MKTPWIWKVIKRSEIPALERKGVTGQEFHSNFLFISFGAAKTDVFLPTGLPAEVDEKFFIRSGAEDIVAIGTIRSDKSYIALVDLHSAGDKIQAAYPWIERFARLQAIQSGFLESAKETYRIAQTWNTGLLRACDAMHEIGSGLLLRIPGEHKPMICIP